MLLLLPVGEVAVAVLLLFPPLLSPNGAGVGAGAGAGVGVGVGAGVGMGAGVGAGVGAGAGAGAAGTEAVALVVGGATVEVLAAALPLLDVAPAA